MFAQQLITLREASAALRAGRVKSIGLVDACLQQIDRCDHRLRAWVTVDRDGARSQAHAADGELQAGGCRGPLHGIPIGIKDIVDVAGWPTLAGSSLRAGHSSASDAKLVARLREAGAVILGKTVTTEHASFDPPPTRNPWNLDRTPGGSSSGSAAAVAAGMCYAAIGTQTGGSITRPAAYCGVVGCKPSYGRVSLSGVLPLAPSLDHAGVVARDVADVALVLDAIAGYDPADPRSIEMPVERYAVDAEYNIPPRLGVLGDFFVNAASTEVRAKVAAAIEILRAAGAVTVDVPLPACFADVTAQHRRAMAFEAAAVHRENFPARRGAYGPCIAQLLDEGLSTSADDYAAALAHRTRFIRDCESLCDHFDALLTPAATSTAPVPETTGDPLFNSPWSYCGLPTVCFPCGLSGDGLPVGLQLVGRRWGEATLLSVADWCERRIGFTARAPLLAE